MCKSCGWNTTHTTGFNDSYVEDPALLSLPATHLFWTKSGKSPSDKGHGASAPDVAIPPVASAASLLSSRMGPLIAQYIRQGPMIESFLLSWLTSREL